MIDIIMGLYFVVVLLFGYYLYTSASELEYFEHMKVICGGERKGVVIGYLILVVLAMLWPITGVLKLIVIHINRTFGGE